MSEFERIAAAYRRGAEWQWQNAVKGTLGVAPGLKKAAYDYADKTLPPVDHVAVSEKPFMYGIMEPDGSAYMDEVCVDLSAGPLQEMIDDSEMKGYTVVPLYLQPPSSDVAGYELPADIIESLLAIGKVEWGVSLTQTDDKHASDLLDTLRITREHFGITEAETGINGVYLEGTGTVLAHTGMSPNSPQHARILVGAWNQLVEIAKAHSAKPEADHG